MDRAQLIKNLQDEYALIRARNRAEAEARLRDVEARDPEIGAMRENASVIALSAMRRMMNTTSVDERRAIAEEMREKGLENNNKLRQRLAELGLPGDYLDEKFHCEKCHDTGYTEDIPARFCECFERALRLRMFEDGTMAGLDEQNFDKFDEALVSRANTEENADILMRARNYCRRYASEFPNNRIPNLLLTGPGGVGKTFLLNCIFAAITARGLSAVRVTAYRMHDIMRRKHFGADDDAESFESLINAPLLLIDDLGTEPMLKNITVEYLFTLLNERNAARRATVIATNLSPDNIRQRYGERVSSRILERSRCLMIMLEGSDLRRA